MAKTDLTFMNDYTVDYPDTPFIEPTVFYSTRPVESQRSKSEYNPFEEAIKKKMKKDFEDFINASDKVKIDQQIKELDKKGVITIHYDKLDKTDYLSYRKQEREETPVSDKTKSFLWGLLTGIGLMMMLL